MSEPITLKTLLAEVAEHYEVSPHELLRPSPRRKTSHPRHAFMWHAYEQRRDDGRRRYSTTMIGQFLGQDHTTVIYGIREHRKRMAEPTPQERKNVWMRCDVPLSPERETGQY